MTAEWPAQPQKPSPAEAAEASMGEMETLAYLQMHGVERLRSEAWQPHQPVLYVLEEFVRVDNGPLGNIPRNLRPSIVRVDDPAKIDFANPITETGDGLPDRTIYKLQNKGGRIDYYAIPKDGGLPIWVRGSNRVRPSYNVRKEELFVVNNDLFPKGTQPISPE